MPPDEGGESDENKSGETTPTTEAPSGGQKVKRQANEEQEREVFTQLGPQAKLYITIVAKNYKHWPYTGIQARKRQSRQTATCSQIFK